ncbi:MAG: InlB B-repeat-containing protein [Spirochaetaceae bacterium]|jgi:hypothetical protein|nr:InlB B-repeat-containing protein [Spirochaetaceae bacterium]
MEDRARFFVSLLIGTVIFYGCANINDNSGGKSPINTDGMVKVIFDPNGGNWESVEVSAWEIESAIPKDTLIQFPSKAPLHRGWVLAGWYYEALPPIGYNEDEPEGRAPEGAIASEDTRLFALWREKPNDAYAVIFRKYTGDNHPVTKLALKENGWRVAAQDIPSLGTRNFWQSDNKWWTLAEGGTEFNETKVVYAETTVYGHWTGIVSKLYFDPSGGIWTGSLFNEDKSVYPPAGGGGQCYVELQYPAVKPQCLPLTLPKKAVEGGRDLAFLGWTLIPEAEKESVANIGAEDSAEFIPFNIDNCPDITTDTTVYAVWKQVAPDKKPIIFTTFGGQTETRFAQQDGEVYRINENDFPVPRRLHFALSTWNTKIDGSGTAFTGTIPSASSVNPEGSSHWTVYALWNTNNYTVNYRLNYDCNGEREYQTENAPGHFSYLEEIALPAKPARSGWNFVRWDSDMNGVGDVFLGGKITSDKTVYAVWSIASSYTLPSPNEDGGYKQTIIIPRIGWYRIELWGAQGCDAEILDGKGFGGRGAYTRGDVWLQADDTFYLYIGGKALGSMGGYNGGGNGLAFNAGGGGGASDIRTVDHSDLSGLASRIMVAGGGGGACDARWTTNNGATGPNRRWNGGFGGGDIYTIGKREVGGGSGEGISCGYGGSQISGGSGANIISGAFGIGGSPKYNTEEITGGGGGGWFGGGAAGIYSTNGGGGGGSSYISGYSGCIATSIQDGFAAKTGNNDLEKSCSWTGRYFAKSEMLSGKDIMPKPEGGTETGHSGSGFGRVVFLGNTEICP